MLPLPLPPVGAAAAAWIPAEFGCPDGNAPPEVGKEGFTNMLLLLLLMFPCSLLCSSELGERV